MGTIADIREFASFNENLEDKGESESEEDKGESESEEDKDGSEAESKNGQKSLHNIAEQTSQEIYPLEHDFEPHLPSIEQLIRLGKLDPTTALRVDRYLRENEW